jgi:hypothetical protein
VTKLTVEVGVLIAVLGVTISFLSYSLKRQNQTKSETREDANTRAQLDYISKGVDDIRIDLRANERQMAVLGERVTRVEESSKQAHKRLDIFEQKGEV